MLVFEGSTDEVITFGLVICVCWFDCSGCDVTERCGHWGTAACKRVIGAAVMSCLGGSVLMLVVATVLMEACGMLTVGAWILRCFWYCQIWRLYYQMCVFSSPFFQSDC